MMVILLCMVVAVAMFYYFFVLPMDYWKKRGVPQGKPIWLFGDIYRNIFGLENFTITVDKAYKKAPGSRYCGIYQFTRPTLIIRDPNLLKQIAVRDFEYFVNHRDSIPEEIDPLWGKNLFALKDAKWKHMRPAVSPSFTLSKMRFLFELMSDCAENFVKTLSERGDVLDITVIDIMSRYTNDVIASTAFGVSVDSLKYPDNEFYAMAKEATNLATTRVKLTFLASLILPFRAVKLMGLNIFRPHVADFFRGVVSESIKLRKEKGIVRPDLIHILLEAGKNSQNKKTNIEDDITTADILAQAMIYLVGGFDTVSRNLDFLCYELALNKSVQDRLRKEIMEIKGATNGKLTYESISKLKYMDLVLSETLRKYPVMSGTDRICTKPYVIEPVGPGEKPLVIEKDTVVWLPVYSLHHNPKNFKNPEVFDPERFNEENGNSVYPYTYIPFGVGPRNCIGARFSILNVKAMVFHLLSNFELFPSKKTKIPLKWRKNTLFIIPSSDICIEMRRVK